MIITIDTNKDSKEDIAKIIEILNCYVKDPVNNVQGGVQGRVQDELQDELQDDVKDEVQTETQKDFQGEIQEEVQSKEENLEQEPLMFETTMFEAKESLQQEQSFDRNNEAGVHHKNFMHISVKRDVGTAPDFTAYLDLVRQKEEAKRSNNENEEN